MPTLLRDHLDDPLDPFIHRESEGEVQATVHTRGRERMRRAGRVRPGQHPRGVRVARSGSSIVGEAGQRHVQHPDVIGGGVGAGVARTQQPRQRLPTGHVGTVQEAEQGMEPEGLLPGRGGVLLLTVRHGDGGVEVQPQLPAQRAEVGAGTGGPRPGPGRRPRGTDPGQVSLVDPVQHPPRGRHRRHRPEQVLPITQHRDPADRIGAVGDRDRQVGEHPPRGMHRHAPVGVQQRCGDPVPEAGVLGHLSQQPDPGVRHHPRAVGADHDPTCPLVTLHSTGARSVGDF